MMKKLDDLCDTFPLELERLLRTSPKLFTTSCFLHWPFLKGKQGVFSVQILVDVQIVSGLKNLVPKKEWGMVNITSQVDDRLWVPDSF